MNADRALNGLLKLAIAVAVIGGGALAVIAVLDRVATGERAAERRALVTPRARNLPAAISGRLVANGTTATSTSPPIRAALIWASPR